MELFFKLEAGYLGIAVFTLLIALFVITRPFMKHRSYKKEITVLCVLIAISIGTHYLVTKSRITEVETAFNNNQKVLCESRAIRKVAQSVSIEKSNEWTLKDHMFTSPNYQRAFFTARCIKYVPIKMPN